MKSVQNVNAYGWLLAVPLTLLYAGCASRPLTPEPLEGLGWSINAQGYHLVQAQVSSQTQGNTTTTTSSSSSGLVNVRQNKKPSPDEIPCEVSVGHSVTDYKWNEPLRKQAKLGE